MSEYTFKMLISRLETKTKSSIYVIINIYWISLFGQDIGSISPKVCAPSDRLSKGHRSKIVWLNQIGKFWIKLILQQRNF